MATGKKSAHNCRFSDQEWANIQAVAIHLGFGERRGNSFAINAAINEFMKKHKIEAPTLETEI